jgi:hypothetical protein
MSNVEVLNTVDLNNAQTEELENTAAELSEDQLDNVNAGYGIRLEDGFEVDGLRKMPWTRVTW